MVWSFWLWTTLVVFQSVRESSCSYQPFALPPDLQSYFDAFERRLDLTQIEGEDVFWTCVQQFIWRLANFTQQTNDLRSPQVQRVFTSLLDEARAFSTRGRTKRQAGRQGQGQGQARQGQTGQRRRRPQIRIRLELRQMTRRQRRRFFRAVNRMKRDRSIEPNVYDWLAGMHRGQNIGRAHFGPAFPGWHRVYLWIYETLLRRYIPDVTVPYWCSHLDGGMTNPADSIIWSNEFMGNPSGIVNQGPFANWERINPATVPDRAVGQASNQLYTLEGIARIMSRTRHADILRPTFLQGTDFEGDHGLGHVHVAGSMNNLNRAAFDPIFFCHHAYVDKLWEDFRIKIRRVDGRNPSTDYPYDPLDPRFSDLHRPNSTMGFGFGFTNIFGYSDIFSEFIQYSPEPSCSRGPDCGAIFYRCERGRCRSRSRTEMPTVNYVNDTIRDLPATGNSSCPPTDTLQTLYNNYEINGKRDPSKWVYFSVKVVSKRRSEFKRFPSYSTYKNRSTPTSSVTSTGTNNLFSEAPANLAKHENCVNEDHTSGKIKVVSYGLNYMGHYFDYALIDKRMPLSIATAFVGVKAPGIEGTNTEAILAAFDECGRPCRAYTKSEDGHFSGAIRVTSDQPRMYGRNMEEAMSGFWDQASEASCPRLDKDDTYITFYCDYKNIWPWTSYPVGEPLEPIDAGGLGQGSVRDQHLRGFVSSPHNESFSIGNGLSVQLLQPSPARPDLNVRLPLVESRSARFGRGGSSIARMQSLSFSDSQIPVTTGQLRRQARPRRTQRVRTGSASGSPVSTGTFQRRSGVSSNFLRPGTFARPLRTGTRSPGLSLALRSVRFARPPLSVQNWWHRQRRPTAVPVV